MSFNLKICEYAAYAMYHAHKQATLDEVAHVVRRYLGKDLVVPNGVGYTLFGKKVGIPDAWKKKHKIIAYLGPEQCKNGHIILPKWKRLMDEGEKKHPDLGFVFVAHTNDYKQLESDLCFANIFHPMLYDHNNLFQKVNHIPNNSAFHACLLDEENTIMFVGLPIKDPKIWEECKNVMIFNNLMIESQKSSKIISTKIRNVKNKKTSK